MKTYYSIFILCITIIAVSTKYLEGHNGRPHCNTEEEVQEFYWRNHNDPTVYWACNTLYEPAELMHCPEDTAFSTRHRQCIGWDQWEWVEPINPPSMA